LYLLLSPSFLRHVRLWAVTAPVIACGAIWEGFSCWNLADAGGIILWLAGTTVFLFKRNQANYLFLITGPSVWYLGLKAVSVCQKYHLFENLVKRLWRE
jgi:carbon starvation protein CstA